MVAVSCHVQPCYDPRLLLTPLSTSGMKVNLLNILSSQTVSVNTFLVKLLQVGKCLIKSTQQLFGCVNPKVFCSIMCSLHALKHQ